MSLYNLLHGQNPQSDILLKILDIDQPKGNWHSGRFRDIYLNEDGTEIILYTRNGGGNRDSYFPYSIREHSNYKTDWDDDFDSTYAYISFTIPEEYQELCRFLANGEVPKSISEKFHATMEDMKTMKPEDLEKDPRFKPMVDILRKLTE